MEMRDMKDQLQTLASNIGVAVPREIVERGDFPSERGDFVIVRDANSSDVNVRRESGSTGEPDHDSFIEDVAYEIEGEEPRPPSSRPPTSSQSTPVSGGEHPNGQPDERPDEADADDTLPTLEEAEQDLIRKALRQFDGNRRQTAKALGISERTLYRKLKEIDEDL